MTPVNFNKFNSYICNPDVSYKFLLPKLNHVPSINQFKFYLKYVFTNAHVYNPLTIKAHLMMLSILPIRCESTSRIIKVRYGKNRCHSEIFIKVNMNQLYTILCHQFKKPIPQGIANKGLLKEASFFTFPGFTKILKFTSWQRNINLIFDVKTSTRENNAYFMLFYKTAFFD